MFLYFHFQYIKGKSIVKNIQKTVQKLLTHWKKIRTFSQIID